MSNFEETWNYTLSTSSTPYAYNNGSPYLSGGRAYFPTNSFINKDTVGYLQFGGNNYVGDYALKMDVDLTNIGQETHFINLLYGGPSSWAPALARRGSGICLTWGAYDHPHQFYGSDRNYVNTTNRGNFDGRVVAGLTGTIIYLKRRSGSYSYTAAHFIDAAGNHYASGWSYASDPYAHNQLGMNSTPIGVTGTASISKLHVADNLDLATINSILATGNMPGVVPALSMTPPGGAAQGAVSVTMSISPNNPDWSIHYTINGATPDQNSPVYTAPIQLALQPGDNVTVKGIVYNATLGTFGSVIVNSYLFTIIPPLPAGKSTVADAIIEFVDQYDMTAIPPAGFQYIYTLDKSDPAVPGNPSVRIWQEGDVVPFGAWLPEDVHGYYATVDVRAVTQYIATGACSAEYARATIYMSVDAVQGAIESGAVHSALQMTLYSASPGVTLYTYLGTLADFATATHVAHVNNSVFSVPWSTTPVTYTFYAKAADGSLSSDAYSRTWTFEVGVPFFIPAGAVSLVPVPVRVACATAGTVLHYTLDGSDPTPSSPVVTGPVSVEPWQDIKAIAVLGGAASPMASASVLPEYEVAAVASTAVGTDKYHYYEATQRVALTSDLGCSRNIVVSTNNVSTTPMVVKSDDGVDIDVFAWDTCGSVQDNVMGVNSALTAFTCRPGQMTKHWSRFCFRTAFSIDVSLVFNAALTAWLTDSYAPLLFRLASRSCMVQAQLRVVGPNLVCTATVDRRGNGTSPQPGTVTGPVPSGSATVHLRGVSGAVNITLDSLTLVMASADLTDPWYVEIETGAVGLTSANPVASVPASITTTADTYLLRRAPLALVGSLVPVAQVPASGNQTTTLEHTFDKPLNPVLFAYGASNKIPLISYSREEQGLVMVGPGGWLEYMKYAVDTSKTFSVEVDLDTYIKAYGDENYNPAHITLMLAAPAASQSGYVDTNVFAQYNITRLYEEIQARVQDAVGFSRVNLREHRELKLRISGSNGVVVTSAYLDGAWFEIGTQPAPDTVQAHVYVKFNDNNSRNLSRFVLKSLKITGVLARNTLADAAITGIDVLSKGVGVGFTNYIIPQNTPNTNSLLVMNRDTGVVTSAPLQFEATDEVAVLGVLETDHVGLVAWTPLVSSRTIRSRTSDADGNLGAGYLLGVGTAPTVVDGRLQWTEAGYLRSIPVTDTAWHAPDNQQHAWTRTRLIHCVDRHKITVAAVAGRA